MASQKPEMLAHHFEKAKRWEEAIEQLIKAGHRYRSLQAFEQAIVYCRKARKLLSNLGVAEDRAAQWLDLVQLEGPLFMFTEGFTSANVNRAYRQMSEMALILGDENARFQGLRGVGTYELFTGKPQSALKEGQENS